MARPFFGAIHLLFLHRFIALDIHQNTHLSFSNKKKFILDLTF